jgi:predicted GNAT family N-acyltransferase
MREWRHRGIGAGILEALIHAARQRKTFRIELHAQVQATAFYGRYGFREAGNIFDEAGIPHVTMAKVLDPVK